MKKLILLFLLSSFQLMAQKRSNEIGIGLGRIINYAGIVPGDNWQVQSVNYSDATFTSPNTEVLSFFQSPTLYYQHRINKHVKFVSSFNFVSSKTSGTIYYNPSEVAFNDFTSFLENKKVYIFTTGLSTGTEYKQGRFYIGAQLGTSIQTGKKILYNTSKSENIKQSITNEKNDVYYNPTPIFFGELLMGGQVKISSFMSFNLEGGVVHTAFFAPISRLSLNYHF